MKDNLYTKESVEKIMNGVRRCASVVGATMGTSGNNTLLEAFERPGFYSTNDGATILESIRFEDPLEELGRKIIYEAVSRANKSSGDGSSTTTVLTASILEEGMKHIKDTSPMELKRSLEACIPLIEKSLNEQKREITVDSVAAVASISAEDEGIGNRIQEIHQKIGKDGIIAWDVSKTAEDYYTLGTGLTISGAKVASPYMCDVDEKTGAFLNGVKWKNPLILLYKNKISSAHEFNDFFGALNSQDKKEIIVFCDEIEFPAIANLVETRVQKGFRAVIVKMPVLWKDEWWIDLAKASGATIVEPGGVVNLKNIKQTHLGTFGYIVVGKEDTFIDGIQDLSEHIKELQDSGEEKNLVRASRLNLKTARYYVGGHSESSIAYRRLKVEDSINAAACALNNGIVPGGGIALYTATEALPSGQVGGIILGQAMKAPFNWITKNSGIKNNFRGFDTFNNNLGYNSKTGKLVDMFEANIVDPTDVVINAIKNAIGVAAQILTIGNIVLLPREEKQTLQ